MTAFDAIGKHVLPTKTWNPVATAPEQLIDYIDLSAIDSNSKQISDVKQVLGKDAPSRARQLVKVADVLVSTVRPNLNGLAIVPEKLNGATASTGFTVLRANKTSLAARYLYQWLKTPEFISDMAKKATGQSYPAVSDRIVLGSLMPLPNIEEQRRIATILDQAEALRAKRRQALAKLDTLTQSLFLEMFGDPRLNKKDWPIRELGKVCKLDRGVSKHRPRNAPELLNGPYPLIQTGDVANCYGVVKTYSSTYSEAGLKQSRMWPAGTLCITIAANIAKTGVLGMDACFPDSVVGLLPGSSMTTEFVQAWLGFLQKGLEDSAPESAQKNINLEILRGLQIIEPPKTKQETFSASVSAYYKLRTQHEEASLVEAKLFGSLQHRAFRDEL